METLTVYPSRWRLLLLALLLLPLALGSLLTLDDADAGTQLLGVGGLVFFGGLFVFLLVAAIRHKPAIILSDAGIEDMRLKIGVIPWAEVTRAYELPYLWQKNVQVLVRDPAHFKRKQPALLRSLGELNVLSGWAPFVLVTTNTDTSAKTVVDYIYRQLLRQWPTPAPGVAAPVAASGPPEQY